MILLNATSVFKDELACRLEICLRWSQIQLYHASRIVESRVQSLTLARDMRKGKTYATRVSLGSRTFACACACSSSRGLFSPLEMTDYSYSTDIQHSATNKRKNIIEESISTLWPGVMSSVWRKFTFEFKDCIVFLSSKPDPFDFVSWCLHSLS